MRIWVLGILALLAIYVEKGMALKGLSVTTHWGAEHVYMEGETVFELNYGGLNEHWVCLCACAVIIFDM